MIKRIHLIRTHITVGTGGPIPPLEILYVASHIQERFPDQYEFKVTDTGIGDMAENDVMREMENFNPDVVMLYALSWEAGLVHRLAALSKSWKAGVKVVVFGQLATFSSQYLCEDRHIDFVVVGEPELTAGELIGVLGNQKNDFKHISGLVYKDGDRTVTTSPCEYPENIDGFNIIPFAWDLIDIKEYARYSNWNGALKEDFYIPILTSRGCPFKCTFCRETYGKKFLTRSPEHVVEEIKYLHTRFGAKEFHIYDAVFNYDNERAKKICRLISEAGLNISLAFPHGVRADIMTEELLDLLKQAGTYKLVYGIESASSRLQKAFRKNLNLHQVNEMIAKTSEKGIITGGYFMLGHLSESEEEINQTIDFAVNSELDVASFFKATDYDDVNKIYESGFKESADNREIFEQIKDIAYYSVKRSQAEVSAEDLNRMILKAQRRFYFKWSRIRRGFRKYPDKRKYAQNLMNALGLIIQAYILQSVMEGQAGKQEKESLMAASG